MNDMLEGLACILWGLLAVILLFTMAVITHSWLGMFGAVITAGLTYIFQAASLRPMNPGVFSILFALPIATFALTFLAICAG